MVLKELVNGKVCDLLLTERNMSWAPWKSDPYLMYLPSNLMNLSIGPLNSRKNFSLCKASLCSGEYTHHLLKLMWLIPGSSTHPLSVLSLVCIISNEKSKALNLELPPGTCMLAYPVAVAQIEFH